MLPLVAMFSLACSGSCRSAQARPGDSGDTDTDGDPAPIEEWLAGTRWQCDLVAPYGPDEYRIPHSWEFGTETVDSDIAAAIKVAIDSGQISAPDIGYRVGLYLWGHPDSFGNWIVDMDLSDRRWRGFGDRLALVERAAPSVTESAYTPLEIDRYVRHSQTWAIFDLGDQTSHVIDCELLP